MAGVDIGTVTIDETPAEPSDEHGCKERVKSCLLPVWNSVWMKILFYVLLPMGLYLFDAITDLSLAIQYYNSEDFTWFGLTLGFVLGPSMIMNVILPVFISHIDHDEVNKYVKYLLRFLQLGVFLEYFQLFRLLLKDADEDLEDRVRTTFSTTHLLEAMLESVPQLCLQLYIILSTGEQVSVLKVITMVISLLAAVKAVVTCWYYGINEADRTCSCRFVTRLILLTVWKVVELSTRVLAVALFASAFKPWIALPIGVHWLVMTVTFIWIEEDSRGCPNVFAAALFMAVDIFSMIASMAYKRAFWLNTVLTLLGNITMVTVWYTLKAGQDWYDVPALVGVVVGSAVSAGLGFIEMVLIGKIESPFMLCCKQPSNQHIQKGSEQQVPDHGASIELDTVENSMPTKEYSIV